MLDANVISHINDPDMNWLPLHFNLYHTMLRPFLMRTHHDINYFVKHVFLSTQYVRGSSSSAIAIQSYIRVFRMVNLPSKRSLLQLPQDAPVWQVALRFFEVVTEGMGIIPRNTFNLQWGRTESDGIYRIVVRYFRHVPIQDYPLWYGWFDSDGDYLQPGILEDE